MVTQTDRTRVQLCGRLSVELDGVELAAALRGRQVPLLLAYLVLCRDRLVGREELIGALWPENAPRSQDAALRTLLSRLRSALGPAVLAGRDELRLELPEPAWVDIEAAAADLRHAREALDRGDPRRAWALVQAPLTIAGRGLLPGAQATWLQAARRELADLRLQALEVAGRAGLGLGGGQLAAAERAAHAMIEIEPYRESGYVMLMQAHQAQGNVAEGLRVFDRLRTLLREELGTSPSPDATAAHERLLHPGRPAGHPVIAPRSGVGRPAIELPGELRARAATPLVGRRIELSRLAGWLTAIEAGVPLPGAQAGRVLLLSGEPGIGKTRLLAEIASRAHHDGIMVLAGRAPEETLVPFQPFLEALGQFVSGATVDSLRSAAREHGAELARLLPQVRRRLPELPGAEAGSPETERYRLFEAVAGLLGEISRRTPVLIVLDDLHWADRPSLLLLRHLARAPGTDRIAILGAYRAAERWSEGFGPALAALRRERLLAQMDIGGLPEPDAIELVGVRVGAPPARAFAQALHAETEGNPFFIEEIVRHLADSGVSFQEAGAGELRRFGLPDDVRDVISRRLARLEEAAIEFLRTASVVGRDFEGRLLERVLGVDEDGFLSALEAALEAGLVAESPAEPGRYSFSHALFRETLYESMSITRRARIHRRIGEALEATGAGENLNALAHHFSRAGDPKDGDRAIRYATRAGAQATRMLAHEDAVDHYRRALELLARLQPAATPQRCELLLALGEAQVRSGELIAAWPNFRQAATLAADLRDGDRLARAAIGASRRYVQPPGVVDEDLISLFDQALAMTTHQRDITRVLLLSRLCGALYFSSARGRMPQLSAEATAIAAELGDPRATALAAAARRRAYWDPGHLSQRLVDSTELLRAARQASDHELILTGHAWLIVDLLERGDLAGVDEQMEAFADGARALRQPLFLWHAAVLGAMRAFLDGHLQDAERLAGDALSSGMHAEGVTAPQYYAAQLLAIRREQGRMAELEPAVRQMLAANPARAAWRAALATLLGATGRRREATAELQRLAGDGLTAIPADGDWMISMTLIADLVHELGDAARARTVYDLLLPYRDANVVIGMAAVCLGASSRYLGRLAMTIGDREAALVHLEDALEANRRLQAPVALAHSQLDYAHLVGPGPRSRALVELAAGTARELGLTAVAHRAHRWSSG